MRQVVPFQRIEKFKSSSYVPCIAIHENSCLCVRLLHFLQFVVSTRFSYTIHYSLSSNLYCLIMLSLHHITISSIHSASLSISCFLPSLPLIFWHPPPPPPPFFSTSPLSSYHMQISLFSLSSMSIISLSSPHVLYLHNSNYSLSLRLTVWLSVSSPPYLPSSHSVHFYVLLSLFESLTWSGFRGSLK